MSAPDENGWMPIGDDTPRDGSLILVNVKRRFPSVIPVRWRNDLGQMCWDGDHWWGDDTEITHWQPLPKPPAPLHHEGK